MLKKSYRYAILIQILYLGSINSVEAQRLNAYQLYKADGNHAEFSNLVEASLQSEIVLFGELHNNPISHWLQLELTQALYNTKQQQLVVGMEMFDADDQIKIDEFFAGLIAERNFNEEARLWSNYETDYKPLLEFARVNGIKLVATNVPRRYASLVNREGFEGLERLTPKALEFVAPLPVQYNAELPAYKAMLEMGEMSGHATENFPKAQAIKDATMAHFIVRNFVEGNIFLHFHGAFHSNNYEGIYWYIHQYRPQTRIITISTVEQDSIDTLSEENKGIADFIIAVPTTMTKTY